MKHKCMHGPACDDASPSIRDQREIGSVGLLFIGAQPSDLREFRNLRKVCARLLALVKYLKANISSSAQARQMGTTCNYSQVITCFNDPHHGTRLHKMSCRWDN